MGGKEVFEQMLTDAKRDDPESALAYYGRGVEYSQNGDYDRAILEYDAAIKINPDYANAYDSKGCVYATKGDCNRAITDFNEAIRINPKESFYYRHRGDAYSDKKNYDKAIADFTEAVNLEFNDRLRRASSPNQFSAPASVKPNVPGRQENPEGYREQTQCPG
jgi:tetratricopeptide (TPR) repeat protein